MCDPHEGDKRNAPPLKINERLCTDAKAGGGITSWKDGSNTWFKKGLSPKNKKTCVEHKNVGHKVRNNSSLYMTCVTFFE